MNASNGLKIAGFLIVVLSIISSFFGINVPGNTITVSIANVTVKLIPLMCVIIFGFILIVVGEALRKYNQFKKLFN
jgi:hypothetical protein